MLEHLATRIERRAEGTAACSIQDLFVLLAMSPPSFVACLLISSESSPDSEVQRSFNGSYETCQVAAPCNGSFPDQDLIGRASRLGHAKLMRLASSPRCARLPWLFCNMFSNTTRAATHLPRSDDIGLRRSSNWCVFFLTAPYYVR
jgi:hypothetical protein